MIGQAILHYKILAKLGEGGMGEVYLAEDTKLERKVALKFLPQHLSTDPKLQARFQREAKAAAALNHSNIITVYEIGEHEGRAYIAMEFVHGQSLRELLSQSELPINRMIDILSQVCEGLGKAHQAGIVHRDLKPENIMLDADNKVKILDFGLAKLKGKSKLSFTRSTIGTISYMAPEHCEGAEVDHRADIWAVGVMLYEMVAAKQPFDGEHEAAIIYAIVSEEPEPLARHKIGVSPDLQRIVDKALDKDRDTRYQGITELLADLDRVKKSESVTAKRMSGLQKRKLARAVARYAAFGTVLTMIAIAALYFYNQKPTQFIPATHKQVTFSGKALSPAITPDGQFIAYFVIDSETGGKNIMFQDLAGGRAQKAFSTMEAGLNSFQWSPDGSELIFFLWWTKSPGSRMILVPRSGGSTRELRSVEPIASFSPDGTQLASATRHFKRIVFTNKNTFSTAAIRLPSDIAVFYDIDWSPLGNRIAFLTENEKKFAIWTTNIDGTQQHKVVEDSLNLSSPRWSAKGEAIYFLRAHDQTKDLQKVNIDPTTGKATRVQTFQSGLQMGSSFTLSQDNKRLLYTRELTYSNIWSLNLEKQGEAQILSRRQLTAGTFWIQHLAISPDGKKIAVSMGKETSNIFVMPIDGGEMQQLTFLDLRNAQARWSPDGKYIAFNFNHSGEPKVWRVPADGGVALPFANTTRSADNNLAWAPGANILYQAPASKNFYILNPRTEEEIPLLPPPLRGWIFDPRYSPDGGRLALYWNNDPLGGRGLWVISMRDSTKAFLETGYPGATPIGWSADGKQIYAFDRFEQPIPIFVTSVDGGETKKLATLPPEAMPVMDVTPDGKNLIYIAKAGQSDIWMMEHFDLNNELAKPSEFHNSSLFQQIIYWQEASNLFRKEKYAETEKAYREGFKRYPSFRGTFHDFGWSLNYQKKYAEAEEFFRDELTRYPDDSETHSGLGWNLIWQGKKVEAEQILRQGLQLRHKDFVVLSGILDGIRRVAFENQNYEDAKRYNEEYLEFLLTYQEYFAQNTILKLPAHTQHDKTSVHIQLGAIGILLKEYAYAEKHFRSALAMDSTESQAIQGLGYLFAVQDRFAEAEKYALRALALDSRFANYNLAAWVLVAGEIDLDRGIAFAEKALASKPEDWHENIETYPYYAIPEHTIGLAYLKKSEYEKAVQYLEQAATFAPERQAIQDDLLRAKQRLKEMASK